MVWGFPSIGGGFDPDGVLHGVLFKKMRFGIFRSDPTSRELKIRELFQGSGFSIREQRDYREWLWVNLAIGAALLPSALVAGSIRPIISSISQWKQVRENMQDVQRVLIARGLDLSAHRSHLLPARLPTWIFVPSVKLALRLSPPLRALADANVNESEARGSVNAVIEEAHRLDVRVPHLEDAHRQYRLTDMAPAVPPPASGRKPAHPRRRAAAGTRPTAGLHRAHRPLVPAAHMSRYARTSVERVTSLPDRHVRRV